MNVYFNKSDESFYKEISTDGEFTILEPLNQEWIESIKIKLDNMSFFEKQDDFYEAKIISVDSKINAEFKSLKNNAHFIVELNMELFRQRPKQGTIFYCGKKDEKYYFSR